MSPANCCAVDLQPNVLFILSDQLRAQSVPPAERRVAMPALERLLADGMSFRHALSTCPLYTPYRGMLLTGRHPQTTGGRCRILTCHPTGRS